MRFSATVFFASCFTFSCGSKELKTTKEVVSDNIEVVKETVLEQPVEQSIYGAYTLKDMKVVGHVEPTEQDLEYINQSKERTIDNTVLTLNEDGTFSRVFPHPSGDGTTNTWTGTYEIEETLMVLHAEMNGKTMDMEFSITEHSPETLSVVTDFGQLEMEYIYKK